MSRFSGEASAGLLGRRAECAVLDRLIDNAQADQSSVLVIRGESGQGKSALLDYAHAHAKASGCRVADISGVESEMELAFGGLQQLCASMLGRLDHLPGPQADALRVAFGLSDGEIPDRFLVGLAVLTLLSDAAMRIVLARTPCDGIPWRGATSHGSPAAARPAAAVRMAWRIVNLVHRHAPNAAIAFNSTPGDTFDAAARWLD